MINCDLCTITFDSETKLKEHKSEKHDIRTQENTAENLKFVLIRCNQCDFHATSPQTLQDHINSSHSILKLQQIPSTSINCTRCDFEASDMDTLIGHASVDHALFQCSDCGMFACKFAEYITRNAEFNFSQVPRELSSIF